MTVSTVYATAPGGNGCANSTSTVYATARTGPAGVAQNFHLVGQYYSAPNYTCLEPFLIFDTSGTPDGDGVSAVTASLYGFGNSSTTDFTAKLAASSYDGGAVVAADYVSGADLGALTELASWSSAGYSAAYNDFTETADFKTAINKTGNTSLILFSDRHAADTTPTGNEYVTFGDADATGTTQDPKLDITHAPPLPVAAITGTATASITESSIRAGSKTVIITLTNDTWVASGATFDAQRQAIINGISAAASPAEGWNTKVRDALATSTVVRTSDTVVTVTVPATASYFIQATETITVTVPASALTGAILITATPTFTVADAGEPGLVIGSSTSFVGEGAVGAPDSTGVAVANLVLSTVAAAASPTLTVISPALLTLSAVASAAAPTAVVSTPAQLVLSPVAAVAAPTAVVISPALLTLSTVDAVATPTAALTAPSLLALSSVDAVSTAATTVISPALLSLSAAASLSDATLAQLVTQPYLTLSAVAAVSTATVTVWAPSLVVLSAVGAVSSATLLLQAPALLTLSAVAGTSTAAAEVTTPAAAIAYLVLGTVAAVSTAAATVSTTAYLVLSAVAATGKSVV